MTHLTPEQALQRDQEVLGRGYGKAFRHSCDQLWNTTSNWDRYEALFGSKERVSLLNESSGLFWATIQGMLHEHVLLGLCRLTDPAVQGRFRNLSVQSLFDRDPTDDKQGLSERVANAVEATRFARSWRDKRIAHSDWDQATGSVVAIEPSTGAKISAAILAIHNVLRWIQGRYFDGDMSIPDLGDADANLVLADLARARTMRREERADFEAKRYERLLNKRYEYPSEDYGHARRYKGQSDLPQPPKYSGPLPLDT